jgi:cation:H+ antiporter
MAGLMLGGHLTVTGAVGVAEALGVPKNVIGLTIVAVGTSLPELSASLMAARRGETDLALGNVVGSNLFNLLFILAVTATIAPVPVPVLGHADLAAMVALAVVLLPLSLSQGKIGRFEGGLLIAVYSGCVLWRLS